MIGRLLKNTHKHKKSAKIGISSAIFSYTLTTTQPAFVCSKLSIETLEQSMKDVQS